MLCILLHHFNISFISKKQIKIHPLYEGDFIKKELKLTIIVAKCTHKNHFKRKFHPNVAKPTLPVSTVFVSFIKSAYLASN